MSPKQKNGADEGFTGRWSEYWRVNPRTIQRWVGAANANKMPQVTDVDAMLAWSLSPGFKPVAFRARCSELRAERKGETPPPAGQNGKGDTQVNQDWAAFLKAGAEKTTPDQVEQLQNLERHLAFADFALQKARERGDAHYIKVYTDDLIRFAKAVKEQKLLADKLGLESGEILPRAEIERVVGAIAYWSMAAVDVALPALSKRLLNLSSPEQVREVIEPFLMSTRFFEPHAHAVKLLAGTKLPAWLVERIVDEVDNYVENGRDLAREAQEKMKDNW